MGVAGFAWVATLLGLLALLLADLFLVGRRPHEPSMRECSLWVVFYVGLAVVFGLGLWAVSGPQYAGEFFAGWLTEYSLSVDNLFVFVIIMSRFTVPRVAQQKVLFVGIALALLMRGAFIAAGAAVIGRFEWVFYLFGLFLVYTAVRLSLGGEIDDADFRENALIRWSRRVLPVARGYHGAQTTAVVAGRRLLTPLVIVMIAIGTTDLIFALDSIPAIFGLTREPYLVFAANVFALMGLRQLYFLLGGLLTRLVYLSIGLSVVLGFIGVKLILEALHVNNLPFVNGGEPVPWAPETPISVSLGVILGTLALTTVASLVRSRWVQRPAVPELVFSELSALGDAQRERVHAIYLDAFPAQQRLPFDELVRTAGSGDRLFLVALDPAGPVGFATLSRLTTVASTLLEYLAVERTRRGTGVGTSLWRQLPPALAAWGAPLRLVLEVEDPDEPGIAPTEAEHRQRRMRFYAHHGVTVLPCAEYVMPTVDGGAEPMRLMYLDGTTAQQRQPDGLPDGEALRQLVLALYTEGYDLPDDHPFVQRVRASSGYATPGEAHHGSV